MIFANIQSTEYTIIATLDALNIKSSIPNTLNPSLMKSITHSPNTMVSQTKNSTLSSTMTSNIAWAKTMATRARNNTTLALAKRLTHAQIEGIRNVTLMNGQLLTHVGRCAIIMED